MKKALTALAIVVGFGASQVASGQEEAAGDIYIAKCAKCHGQNGVPKKIAKGAPHFDDPKWQASTNLEGMVKSITEGKGKIMPKFEGKLTPAQIRAVAQHVRGMGNPQKEVNPLKEASTK